jgi:hypothetical protein
MNLNGIKLLLVLVVLFSLNCCNSKKKNLISSIIPSPESILVFDGNCNFQSLHLINSDSSSEDIFFFKEKLNQLYITISFTTTLENPRFITLKKYINNGSIKT